MLSLGICIGASSISYTVLEQLGTALHLRHWSNNPHEGKIQDLLQATLDNWHSQVSRIAITGRQLQGRLSIPTIAEPVAVELAYRHISQRYPACPAVISAGSETFVGYRLNTMGRITGVYTGNRCASGTGEFFMQQIARMGLTVEAAIAQVDCQNPLPVATRCSVFCKSDCTHALNKGVDRGRVIGGLSLMLAQKIQGLLQQCRARQCLLIGGVTRITPIIAMLQQQGIEAVAPAEALYFEALGASLWALNNATPMNQPTAGQVALQSHRCFEQLAPLDQFAPLVEFKQAATTPLHPDKPCVVGIDVGSTTTKAVVVQASDQAVIDQIYLRTEGNPVAAARRCYQALADKLDQSLNVIGLGVTGSGRQIVGLHALTTVIINEIIAHATAAAFYDPTVDTIIEIGGQDAKYTLLQNGVPLEYAMNEACSAGTGSFLEEAARESLGIAPNAIGQVALQATAPPNFNDQCSAFIGSDIKTALQAGISSADVTAGLVYSICQNYLNRVKGSRAIGQKILMQGGVCYNPAVPLAMAGLLQRDVVVPPNPGLMGAYGVALEIISRLDRGQLQPQGFDLKLLAQREAAMERTFTCQGGKEHCDLRCSITMIKIEGKLYPFGGACSRYTGLTNREQKPARINPVTLQQQSLWKVTANSSASPTIGINRSLLTHALFPLYNAFFQALGLNVIIPPAPYPQAKDRLTANFCYPVELSHTYLAALIDQQPDWLFLPHVAGYPAPMPGSSTCPLLQAEPYYLQAAFPEYPRERVLTPVINLSAGLEAVAPVFIKLAQRLGLTRTRGRHAFQEAAAAQQSHWLNEQQQGIALLRQLEQASGQFAVVLFGRPYNALAPEANLAVPQKFTSRGIQVIPHQWLPCADQPIPQSMYWSMGQSILQTAQMVRSNPLLFGCYLTNFSCGPDSFLINYFREIMGSKPALVLELDNHTADAGLDTRIEAFLDIIKANLASQYHQDAKPRQYRATRTFWQGATFRIEDSRGQVYALDDHHVKLVIPSMGRFGNQTLAATFQRQGINAQALQPPSPAELNKGKSYTSCKECLPLQLTAGSLLTYLEQRHDPGEVTVYFMPKTSGPCRFGQYHVLLEQIIAKLDVPNVTFMSLSSANSYAGLPTATIARAWQAVVIADVLEEIEYGLKALACDQRQALASFQPVVQTVLEVLQTGSWKDLQQTLQRSALLLQQIPLNVESPKPRVLLTGEIYVRKDPLAHQYLADRLAQAGIIVIPAPIGEWLNYCDLLYRQERFPARKRIKMKAERTYKGYVERKIKRLLSASGLYHHQPYNARLQVNAARHLLPLELRGEAVLTVGGILAEAAHLDGAVAVGPFGCMPHRIAEAILTPVLQRTNDQFPFLAVESDGGPFPRAVETRLEAFIDHVHQQATNRNRQF